MSNSPQCIKHLSIAIHDEGASIPILFVHGYPLDSSMWANQIDYFRGRYTVATIDLRGFGKSVVNSVASQAANSTPLDDYSMASLADDCMEALNSVGIAGPIVVCGLSMGGYIALEMWKRHSDRIAAMILCDTRAIADSPEGAALRISIAERVVREGTAAVVMPMIPKLLAEETIRVSPAIVSKLEKIMCNVPPMTIAAAQRAMAVRSDFVAALDQIQVPVQLIVGESDAISSPDEMRGIANRISNSSFDVIARAGHLPPIENPEQFNQVVQKFLSVLGL